MDNTKRMFISIDICNIPGQASSSRPASTNVNQYQTPRQSKEMLSTLCTDVACSAAEFCPFVSRFQVNAKCSTLNQTNETRRDSEALTAWYKLSSSKLLKFLPQMSRIISSGGGSHDTRHPLYSGPMIAEKCPHVCGESVDEESPVTPTSSFLCQSLRDRKVVTVHTNDGHEHPQLLCAAIRFGDEQGSIREGVGLDGRGHQRSVLSIVTIQIKLLIIWRTLISLTNSTDSTTLVALPVPPIPGELMHQGVLVAPTPRRRINDRRGSCPS